MAKNKVVTSSMAVALAMCTTTGSFATEPVVTDTNVKTEQVTAKDSDKEKPTEGETEGEDKPNDKPTEGGTTEEKPNVEKPEGGTEEKPNDGVEKPTEKPDVEFGKGMIDKGEYYDNTNIMVKGGFHLFVRHDFGNTSAKFKDVVPTMTFELLDEKGKSLGTAVANDSNYKKGEGYSLHFKNVPEFKKGDKFRLRLKSADNVVKHIVMVYSDAYTEEDKDNDGEADFEVKNSNLAKGKEQLFSVGIDTGREFKGEKWIDEVIGSKNAPMQVAMVTDSSKVAVKVVKDGKPQANKKFEIERTINQSKFTATTDSRGIMWLDRKKVEPVIEVKSLDEKFEFDGWDGKAEVILPITSVEQELDDFLSTTLELKDAVIEEDDEIVSLGKISTSMKVNGSTDISDYWTEVEIQLKNTKDGSTFDYTLNKDTKELDNIPNGTYNVTVKSKTAKVDVAKQVTVRDGKANLSMTVSPNHILEVVKRVDGKYVNYNFSVINAANVKDKQYKGSKATRFGVVPNETFMVKDNDTGEVFNVTIGEKIGVTKLILGEGVILSADGTSPHTRDMEGMYLGLFGASLLLAGFMVYNRSKDKKKALQSLLMVSVVAGSLMSMTPEVFAGAGGDSGGGSGGTGGQGGHLNTVDGATTLSDGKKVKQVVQFGFVPTYHILPDGSTYGGMSLTEDGNESDLASSYKFTDSALKYALYMPLDANTASDFQKSGVLDFSANQNAYFLIRGQNRLHNKIRTKDGSQPTKDAADLYASMVEQPSAAKNSKNYCLQIMGDVLSSAQSNSKGIYAENYGDKLNAKINSLSTEQRDKFFNDYLELIGNRKGNDVNIDKLKKEYKEGKITFAAQTLLRVHKGSDKNNGMYMSPHSLARALGEGEGVSNHVYSRERRYLSKNSKGYCAIGSTGKCYKANCKTVNHASYGTWRYMHNGYTKTIQAVTHPKPGSNITPVPKGVFGGWGFFHWKDSKPATAEPSLTVKSVIDLYDESGKKVGTKTVTSDKINNTSFKTLNSDRVNYQGNILLTQGTIEYNGKKYKIKKENTNKVELKDIKDNKSLYSDKLDGKTPSKPSINVSLGMSSDGSPVTTKLKDILNPHSPLDYNTHLGGAGEQGEDGNGTNSDFDTGGTLTPSVVDKYENQYDDKGNKIFSDAEATVYLKAEEVTDKVKVAYEVPQWRLSRYWEDLSVAGRLANASYELTVPQSDDANSHASTDVTPKGASQMKTKPVDVSKSPWLKINPYFKNPSNPVAMVSHGGASLSTPITGKMVATKTTKDVDNVNFANWKGSGYTNEIASSDKGNTNYKYRNSVTKNAQLKFFMEDPKTYTHIRKVYKHEKRWVSTGTDSLGNATGYNKDVCKCYTASEGTSKSYNPARYDIAMTYFRHHPSNVSTVKLKGEKGKEEAFSWETKPTSALKVYPEVTMANSDISGRTNVSIVAGDLDREVNPLSYHFLRLDAEVGSKVVGTSVATDPKAQSLVQKVVSNSGGANVVQGGAQVVHKGSATNTSYTIKGTPKGIKQDKGTLTAKTFAVDIGNTALKNSWNPGTTYNTDKVNEAYLSQFGTKEGNNWKFTAKFQPGLKIGTNEYKGKLETKPITGIPQATKEYSLVVRSGKLTLVSGKSPTKLTPELQTALDRMKLKGTDKTVLDVFEYNKGHQLSEQEVADLMNAVRGTNELKKGGNWYHEDTTVLVVREYTTVFDLPEAHMYSDKIQMQIPNLNTPMDKGQFYTNGLAGHTILEIGIDKSDVLLKYDSSLGKWSKDNKKEIQYIVPNVSILDTTK